MSNFGITVDDDLNASFGEVAQDDPARTIIATILRIVPVSHWSFARFKGVGDADQLLSSTGDRTDFSRLKRQFIAQRRQTAGPSINPTSGMLAPYESGLTLLFADARADFGILTLLRSAELGSFSSSEIRMLAFALDAASERFSALRLRESLDETVAGFHIEGFPSAPAVEDYDDNSELYILDRDLQIVLAFSDGPERQVALTTLQARLDKRLPLILEEAVRELTSSWTDDVATRRRGVAQPVPFLVVRTQPLSGPTGLFIGVSFERFSTRDPLAPAFDHFRISPREIQVLALLLDGARINDVGRRLHIAPTTVQDHIKSLLRKTDTRNRSEMIAKVLRFK